MASAEAGGGAATPPGLWIEVAPGLMAFSGALAAEFDLCSVPHEAGGWLDADPAFLLETLRSRALATFSDFLAAGDVEALRLRFVQARPLLRIVFGFNFQP
jgi:hypothetical protein